MSISERHPTLGGFEDLLERQKRTMMKNYRVHVNNVVSTVREFIRELRNNYSSYQEIPINQYQIYFIDFTSIVIELSTKKSNPLYSAPSSTFNLECKGRVGAPVRFSRQTYSGQAVSL